MKDLKVSNRYAKALLELAVETNNLENCYSDMNTILTVCQESKEFYLLFSFAEFFYLYSVFPF